MSASMFPSEGSSSISSNIFLHECVSFVYVVEELLLLCEALCWVDSSGMGGSFPSTHSVVRDFLRMEWGRGMVLRLVVLRG